jgi:hypothetical protein
MVSLASPRTNIEAVALVQEMAADQPERNGDEGEPMEKVGRSCLRVKGPLLLAGERTPRTTGTISITADEVSAEGQATVQAHSCRSGPVELLQSEITPNARVVYSAVMYVHK